MKTLTRWTLISVLVANSLIAAFLIGGATSTPTQAQTVAIPKENPKDPTREALRLLGEELAARADELARREAAFEELKRGEEMRLLAAGEASDEPSSDDTAVAAAAGSEAAPVETAPAGSADTLATEAFQRLSKAYENMEPDSAALALAELSAIDQEAVVQLLSGWPPRTSGAILDALTQANPELAAKLSYEIWKRGNKPS